MKLHCGWSLLLILPVMASCTPTPMAGVTVTPLQPDPVPTPVLARITPTFNPILTETPRPTEQFIFYDTPAPTASPTPTPTEFPYESLSFPDWARNPETPLLLGPYSVPAKNVRNERNILALWNGLTGERFDIDVPDLEGFFWAGSILGLGIERGNDRDLWLADLPGSAITKQDLQNQAFYDYDNIWFKGFTPRIIWPWCFGLGDETGYLLGYDPQSEYSSYENMRFHLEINLLDVDSMRDNITVVFDTSLDESFRLTDPTRGVLDLLAEWSPVGPYLAILNVDKPVGPLYASDTPVKFSTSIYNVVDRHRVGTYDGVVIRSWSPDGRSILYQPGSDRIWEEPPCTLDVANGARTCYDRLLADFNTPGSGSTSFYDFKWTPDSQSVSFLYATEPSQSQPYHAGVCILKLTDGSRRCFLESPPNAEPLDAGGLPLAVYAYWPAPDWSVMLFELTRSCKGCDTGEAFSQYGFMNLTTGNITMLAELPITDDSLWRP